MRLGRTGYKSPVNELRSFTKIAGVSHCSAYQSGSDSSSSSVPNPVSDSSTSGCISGSSGRSSSSSGTFGKCHPVVSVTPPSPHAPLALVPLPASSCEPRFPRVAAGGSHRHLSPPPSLRRGGFPPLLRWRPFGLGTTSMSSSR